MNIEAEEVDEDGYAQSIRRPGNRIFRKSKTDTHEIIIEDVNNTRSGQFRTMSENEEADKSKAESKGNQDKSNFVTDFQEYRGPRKKF